jgi:hypothetical protein
MAADMWAVDTLVAGRSAADTSVVDRSVADTPPATAPLVEEDGVRNAVDAGAIARKPGGSRRRR